MRCCLSTKLDVHKLKKGSIVYRMLSGERLDLNKGTRSRCFRVLRLRESLFGISLDENVSRLSLGGDVIVAVVAFIPFGEGKMDRCTVQKRARMAA